MLPSPALSSLSRTLLLVWALLLALGAARAQAADFRDPPNQTFTIWPNIPVIRATDFADYAGDRKIFEDLHNAKGDPATLVAALQAVDALQQHHERAALGELGRSLNVLFISELDRLARATANRTPKLRFDFANITPAELQRAAALDAPALGALKNKAGQVTLVTYMTYARTEGSAIQLTATLVKLADGSQQSFTVTALASQAAAALAQEVFHYFYSTRFAPYRNPLADREWLQPAPGHRDQMVSLEAASRYCQTQGAELPTENEMEVGESSGIYHGGIEAKNDRLYHMRTGQLYVARQSADERVVPNRNPKGSNAYYYCIRKKAGAAVARKR